MKFSEYITTLIEEKGQTLQSSITIEGHFGLTWSVLVDFLGEMKEHQPTIRKKLVMIDFRNGDVFKFLTYLAIGMIQSWGHDTEEAMEEFETRYKMAA